ncbi:uncharacterized protein LOC135943889 [Cloeon dipterum]|uniref:uncharacterized protein LOC135943889 n=1 Tax=Cloeon dipterum TaxID=197152 RepID=UPI0032208AC0
MEIDPNYFAYCLDVKTKINYFIVPSEFLKPRPNARHSNPGFAWDTLGQEFWGAVFQSAWHESLDVDPDDASFLDQSHKNDKDFEHLLTEAEHKECLVLATALSVQELQQFVQSCNIKVPNKCRRLDVSNASVSQQHDEQQQKNEQFRSSESNQQTSNKDNPTASKSLEESTSATSLEGDAHKRPTGATPFSMPPEDTEIETEEPIESHVDSENDDRRDTHIRPDGKANLGFFESAIDGRVIRQNADNVCVLVIHYEFKNDPKEIRNGDACDVEYLKTFFGENRNCNFRNFQSPDKKTLLQLLGDEQKLLRFFNSQDDVPSVFVLFILSHGTQNGIIWTDHIKRNNDEYECFTTDEVFDSLQKLKRFDKCLKVVNFGPCRGLLDDSKFDLKKSKEKYENLNSCRITHRPGMHNFVLFYSTVETTLANTDKNGSWFVRNICVCLNNADDEPLLKFFTIVQNRMHQASLILINFEKNTPLGQTPELKMFQQDKKFIISKATIQANTISDIDGLGDTRKVSNERLSPYFSWKSDEGRDIRGRKGFILSVVQSQKVQEMTKVLQNLDFIVTNWTLSGQSIASYAKMVSKLEPDVGCIMTCIFGPVCENEQQEVCVRVQEGQDIPITDILHSLVGPDNDKLIGKPKIMFVADVEARQTDSISAVDMRELQVSATNHSGWLVLILKYKDALENLIELLGKIGQRSLQELLEPLLLTRECNREDAVLLNSTLQYLIKFPNWPRTFVKPDFKLKMTKIHRDQMIVSFVKSTESLIEEKIDFDTLLKKAMRLFEENKKSIEIMICLDNLPFSSDIEPSINSKPVGNLEAISPARNLAQESIVWLINSVAGGGKSTVLEEMAHQLTKFYGGFQILQIPLKKYYRLILDMPAVKVDEIEFLANTTCISHDDIKNWIVKRELIVFLDGFDEVCPDFRQKLIQILIALQNARVHIFVGTRPHEVHHIQGKIKNSTIVEIEPLDEAKQIEFLETVCQKNRPETEQLRNRFEGQDILGNPLYLKLLAEYSDDKNLYDIFDKMVRRKVEICLKRENGGKDVGDETIEKSLKVIQLVASRFVRGVKIEYGSVTKEELEKMNAFGVVTYGNDTVNFTHQTFAEFLTAQKFLYDLKNPGPEEVPLFNDELVQCRKFVDLFFSTEKGKDATYAQPFVDWAKSSNPLQLVKQICRENLSQMFELLKPDISLRDEDGKNALHFALRHLEMVKMVHEKNSKLATDATNNGESSLHLAIADEKCSEEVAIWLLRKTEVDKNAETRLKDTPLLLACKTKKWKVALELILAGVKLNKNELLEESILYHVVKSNKLELVRALLDRGSNVNLKDDDGATVLHRVAEWRIDLEIVKILLQKGVNVNAQDNGKRTALHYCLVEKFSPEVVLELLKNGADVDLQDQEGFTTLHLAARWNKNPDILKNMLQKGAKVNAQDNGKRTALHYCLVEKFNPVPEMVQELLENGADVNLQDQEGSTALHLSAEWNKNPDILKILLEKDAKVNAEDNKKWTALHLAARYNPVPEVVHQLVNKGAEINAENDNGETALFLAAKHNPAKEVVQILLDHKAEVNEMITNDKECTEVLRQMKIKP